MSQLPEISELKDVTPEQKKEIEKIISKARISIFGIVIKTSVLLLLANFIAMGVGVFVLEDVDVDIQLGYHCVVLFINTISLLGYFNGKMKENSDIAISKIQEILKNNNVTGK